MNNENAFIIAASSGEGISELFMELGADAVLPCVDADSLGADDFAAAIAASGAERVLILPNGARAFDAAESAARLIDSVRVSVLPTHSFAEGYAALVAMPRGESLEQLCNAACAAISSLTPIDICHESGDSFDKYSAISRGECYSLAGGAEAALLEAVERLFRRAHRIITLIVGKGVTNARRVFVTERLGELYPDVQIIVYIGGQTATEYYIALR